MKDDLEQERIGAVPRLRAVVGLGAKTMIGEIRAEIVKKRVLRAVSEKIKIEA